MDTTPRLLLQKPDPDPVTGDFVDVSVLNANADKIDASISFTPCLSTARPSLPFAGQGILETDTGKAYVWGGSAWVPLLVADSVGRVGIGVSPSTSALRMLRVQATGSNGAGSMVLFQTTATPAGNRAFSLYSSTETHDRWQIDFDGKTQWSSGSAVADTSLYRTGVGQLRTDGSFSASAFQVNGNAARVMTQFYDHSLAGTDSSGIAQYLKTTVTDCVGLTRTFTTLKANALAVVTFTGDFESRVSSAGTGVMMLNIDGVNLTIPQSLFNGGNTTAGARSTCSQQAFILLTAAGSHTIKARCQQAVGASDNLRLNNNHTTMNIQIFE